MGTRRIAVVSFALLLIAAVRPARAQEELWRHDGASGFQLVTARIVPIGDLDGDGLPDLLVGSYRAGNSDGVVVALRGADGSVLFTISGSGQEHLGAGLDVLGDLDGDGVDDFIVTMPSYAPAGPSIGRATVYSGANQSVLHTLTGTTIGEFGRSVAAIGDVDGDRFTDFVVGDSSNNAVSLYSGATATHLFDVTDLYAVDFGFAVCRTGDVDGDGVPDFCVGDPTSGRAVLGAGAALVFSGANGSLLRTFVGTDGIYAAYGMVLADVGDLDLDGVDELAVGSPERGRFPGSPHEGGVIDVFSGASGASLAQWRGLDDSSHFGCSVAGLPDLTGDGRPEILVGAPDVSQTYDRHQGAIYIYSGATLKPILYRLGDTNLSPNAGFGESVASAGDADGDGLPDFGVADGGATSAGSIYLLRGNDLFLNSNVKYPRSGTTLNLTTSAGEPGKLAMLVVEGADGVAVFKGIATQVLNANGEWHLLADVPSGLAGHSVALRSYAPDASGRLEKSALESIQFE